MAHLKVELTVFMEGLLPFVKACYDLEGDGFLAPLVYDKLVAVRTHCHNFKLIATSPGFAPVLAYVIREHGVVPAD